MGLIFSFVAGTSFGSYTFKNKCLNNNGQRTCQMRGMEHDGRDCDGKKDQWKTRGEIKSRVCLKMRNVGRCSYLHKFFFENFF